MPEPSAGSGSIRARLRRDHQGAGRGDGIVWLSRASLDGRLTLDDDRRPAASASFLHARGRCSQLRAVQSPRAGCGFRVLPRILPARL